MQRTRTLKRLWDYCGEWVAAIRRLTAHDLPGLDGRVPDEVVEGITRRTSQSMHSLIGINMFGAMIRQYSFRMTRDGLRIGLVWPIVSVTR